MEDPLEGTITAKTNDALTNLFKKVNEEGYFKPPLDDPGIQKAVAEFITRHTAFKPYTVVSCWHNSQTENALMWHAYTNVKAGIMIKSSYDNLKKSIEHSPQDIYISDVKYLDYSNQIMIPRNSSFLFIHKHKFYSDEREIRAMHKVANPNDGWNWDTQESHFGIFVPCNSEILIDEIVVAPFAEQSYFDIVRDVSMKYGLDKPVRYSGLRG